MSGFVILKYFRPILDKKDPLENKELHLGHYRRLYPSLVVTQPQTELYITLKQEL